MRGKRRFRYRGRRSLDYEVTGYPGYSTPGTRGCQEREASNIPQGAVNPPQPPVTRAVLRPDPPTIPPPHPPRVRWRSPRELAETTGEVQGIRETDHRGDLGDRELGVTQQPL